MRYRITNGRSFLTGFFPNDGWKIGNVFAFSNRSWKTFDGESEVQEYLSYIIMACFEQGDRWGDWTDVAVKFAKKLRYEEVIQNGHQTTNFIGTHNQ